MVLSLDETTIPRVQAKHHCRTQGVDENPYPCVDGTCESASLALACEARDESLLELCAIALPIGGRKQPEKHAVEEQRT